MAMTWRERIQAARERGGAFTSADLAAYSNRASCLAAEVAARYDVTFSYAAWHQARGYDESCATKPGWWVLWEIGDKASTAMHAADPVSVEMVLDEIEDRALQLKREAGN